MFDPLNVFVKAQCVQVKSECLREDMMFSLPSPVQFVNICRDTSRKISQGMRLISSSKLFFMGDKEKTLLRLAFLFEDD